MKLATWNINGVKARISNMIAWLEKASPDILCLQETKSTDENFPREALEDCGYNIATHGQKGFNGVAILSKYPFDEVIPRLPGDESDQQARYLEAVISTQAGAIRVASIYLPNGNPVDSDKFPYKLAWMDRLHAHARDILAREEMAVLAGDYNIIPEPQDTYDPNAWRNDALFRHESRDRYHSLLALGYLDAVRACNDRPELYTFWDYQAGAWKKNNGIRIDHILLSPQASDRLVNVRIDSQPRNWERPSDHVPVIASLDVIASLHNNS